MIAIQIKKIGNGSMPSTISKNRIRKFFGRDLNSIATNQDSLIKSSRINYHKNRKLSNRGK